MMRSFFYIRYIALYVLLFAVYPVLPASGDEGHSHAGPKASAAENENYFSAEAVSDKYEILLRYEPIHPGEKSEMTLFVSDFATNKPIDKASLRITAQEDSKMKFSVKQTGPGTYQVETLFPEKKIYSLAVDINAKAGADLILLSNIETGKEIEHPENGISTTGFPGFLGWIFVALALLGGIGLGMLIQKKKSAVSILLLLTLLLSPGNGPIAHGGEDHGAKKQSNNFSNTFAVPKETQFLFEVFTEKTATNNFTESNSLFGTIIPSSNGYAVVSSPQNGKVISLHARVGQDVKAGQTLAVIEQNMDAATQLGLMAEKNNLIAEFESAEKELKRLVSIQDLVAQKDLNEAKARFQKADSNLRLLSGTTGKYITLKSPIAGKVGNFSMSIGSTINAGQDLFTITDLRVVYAEAQVFDKDAAKVKPGAKFTVECSNDNHKTSEVQLLSLAQEINATNQSQRVLFELQNPDNDFKIGEFVNIRVFMPEPSRLIALPNSALTEINGKPVVFIKESAEEYSISYVQLGENNGSFTSILKGVEEGERVVVNGSYQMKMIFINQ